MRQVGKGKCGTTSANNWRIRIARQHGELELEYENLIRNLPEHGSDSDEDSDFDF